MKRKKIKIPAASRRVFLFRQVARVAGFILFLLHPRGKPRGIRNCGINPVHAALIISLIFLGAGLYLTADSYYKRLSVVAASNQITFLKLIPQRITDDEVLKMPLYQENVIMNHNPLLSGTVKGGYYMKKLSVRELEVTVKRGPFSSITLYSLLDARIRN